MPTATGSATALDSARTSPRTRTCSTTATAAPTSTTTTTASPDAADKCPLDAEDKDDFQDDDGCPERDNDGDGIADDAGQVPARARGQGRLRRTPTAAPIPTTTATASSTALDKCPNEPETINGNNDDDGCPDEGDALVVLSPDRLEMLESIEFTGTKITKSSYNVLGQVGATLRAHPEILRIRVTAHVNPTNNAAADQDAVRASARRSCASGSSSGASIRCALQAAGFGGTKPLVPPRRRARRRSTIASS